jgi:hypothetical protein
MKAISLVLLIGYQMAAGLNVVAPYYPANAVYGGNVVAVIEPSAALTKRVRILHAEEPFVEPVRAALVQWRFLNDQKDVAALVVVNFREPSITVTTPHGPKSSTIDCTFYDRRMPVPRLIVDPLYSDVSLTVLGAAILHLKISAAGTVDEVAVIQGLGDHTQAVIEAVKKWQFLPARDESGKPVASEAFAICVYRALKNLNSPDISY